MRYAELLEFVSYKDLANVEKQADEMFARYNIDIEFTRHFRDRMNDARNGDPITATELSNMLKKVYDRYGKMIATQKPDFQAVMKDISSKLNLPFVLDLDMQNYELDLIGKTIMRKDNFKTPNPELRVEAAGVGKVVKGVNTTSDVGPNEIKKQAKKFGNTVDKNGVPPRITGKEGLK
jgi:hypothetical protein